MNYSDSWFKNATDDDLETEREKVRRAFCSAGSDYKLATRLQNLLWRFDSEMSKGTQDSKESTGYPKPREHGWYLPNDD